MGGHDRILLIEDNPGDVLLIQTMLSEAHERRFEVKSAQRLSEGLAQVERNGIGVILLDLGLPDSTGLQTLAAVQARAPEIPVLVLTGDDDEGLALSAVKAGAQDYLLKGRVDGAQLGRAIRYAIERKQAEHALRDAHKALSSLIDAAPLAIQVLDRAGIIRLWNPASEKLLGWQAAEVLGKPPPYLLEQDMQHFAALMRLTLHGETSVGHEMTCATRSGTVLDVHLSIAPQRLAGTAVTGAISMMVDVSERKRAEEVMVYLATHDRLTALPNRNLLDDRLVQAVHHARRTQSMVATMFIDLDRFKLVNDSLGHDQGDEMLEHVAQRLRSAVRADDTVARLGGDEFVVLMGAVEREEDVTAIARKILKLLLQPITLAGEEVAVSASIGIALFPRDGGTGQDLLKNADSAMYTAKESGGNTFRFYSKEMNERLLERLTLENALRRALDQGEMLLHYQPIIELATGRMTGLEALVRWHNPERGLVAPGHFIPLAEVTGLIVPLGDWTLHHACSQVAAFTDGPLAACSVSVNLSPRQFLEDDLEDRIRAALAESGLAPQRLELEITEGVVMQHTERAVPKMRRLRESGVRIALDDFGTGYSSLGYLKRFQIDRLKIDRTFVQGVPDDQGDAAIVRAVLALAHSMRVEVVAEGVENVHQRGFLLDEGCEFGQGFLFSRPVPLETLTRRT
jgi:diguanylate cyclase (GGDEF)-like protein/PAS domain S-box-containing protein